MVCYLIAGNSFDLFLGGVFFAALLAPPLSAIAGQSPGAWVIAVAISMGIGLSWWMPVHAGAVTVGQWLTCYLVLFSFVVLLMAGVRLLVCIRISAVAASPIITIVALLWLSWPVWLSAALAGSQLHWSVTFHPLMAINHVVQDLGIWTEQQVAYGLTNLGQDVQYTLPASVWPVIGLQIGLAIAMEIIVILQPAAARADRD